MDHHWDKPPSPPPLREVREGFGRSVGGGIGSAVGLLIGAWAAFKIIGLLTPYDNTDAPGRRSGLGVYTDAATGCQYLGGALALVPRLDRQGHIMCSLDRSHGDISEAAP